MILNKEDIYENIESFRNMKGFTLDKMAELTGMSDKSAYSAMIKNKRMKLEYLINLVNNSDITIEKIFEKSTKEQQKKYSNDEKLQQVEDNGECLCCREKEKLILKLQADLIESQRETIAALKGEHKKETSDARVAPAV